MKKSVWTYGGRVEGLDASGGRCDFGDFDKGS